MVLLHTAKLATEFIPDLLGGITVIKGKALIKKAGSSLYYSSTGNLYEEDEVDLFAVPYFAWANREPGAMRTWIEVLEL
jgi:DUF1680 family protein